MHKIEKYEKEKHEDWNCNNCPFQGNEASELMKHLKLTAHQPSPKIKDRTKFFQDYKRCYTCDLEVDGYWNFDEPQED